MLLCSFDIDYSDASKAVSKVACFYCDGQHKPVPPRRPSRKQGRYGVICTKGNRLCQTPRVTKPASRVAAPELEAERLLGTLQGVYEIARLLDTGSTVNAMPLRILNELEEKQVPGFLLRLRCVMEAPNTWSLRQGNADWI